MAGLFSANEFYRLWYLKDSFFPMRCLCCTSMKRKIESNFPSALRHVRKAKGMTQEAFDQASSRVYVSALERGIKQPTLPKVDELAGVLEVHPLTLLAFSYCPKLTAEEVRKLCDRITAEAGALSGT